MFKTILVPLDGSAAAEQALPTAARLARAAGAALHLAHVHVPATPDPIMIEGMPVVDEELRSLAAEHERVYLERAAARLAGDGLQPLVKRLEREGSVVQTLTGYARESHAGLIVMTTHGHRGFAHLWLGSVAEALVRASGIPLLLLRPQAEGLSDRPFRHILAPLDGSPPAEQILPHAAAIAGLEGAALTALQVAGAHERGEAEQYLQRAVAGLALARAGTAVRAAEQPASGILEAAAELGADLVAMTTHGRNPETRSPLGSVADRVLRGATLPLLVLRPTG